jgi:hypothetical protein
MQRVLLKNTGSSGLNFSRGGVWRVFLVSVSLRQLYSGTRGNSRLPKKMKFWVFWEDFKGCFWWEWGIWDVFSGYRRACFGGEPQKA